MKSLPRLLLALCAAALALPAHAASLEDGFAHPPDSAKPRTWWHWVSGNVSSEGITADLNAMKHIGVGGAQIFTVDQSEVKGPVVFLSPEWRKLMHQALALAGKLGLEISMEGCDGWSESGGHWVTPAQGMQKVVWTEKHVQGGKRVSLALPQPETALKYYEDIALFAFPTLDGDNLPAPEKVTASASGFQAPKKTAGHAAPFHVSNDKPGEPVWLAYEYAKPIRCASLAFAIANWSDRKATGEFQAGDDGVTFHKVCAINQKYEGSFPPVQARFFRLWYPKAPAARKVIDFGPMHLGGARLADPVGQTGMRVSLNLAFSGATAAAGDAIDPKRLLDLTGKKEWDAPTGDWTLVRLGHTATGATTHPSTTPGLECDKMSRAAVESHIENLFTPVWEDSPKEVGSSFRYILLDSWEAGCENWTPLLREDFTDAPRLRSLAVAARAHGPHRREPGRDRAVPVGLPPHAGRPRGRQPLRRLPGGGARPRHGPHLRSARGSACPPWPTGSSARAARTSPWASFGSTRPTIGNFDDPKEAASAAHIYGQNIAATESFTSTPEHRAVEERPLLPQGAGATSSSAWA